jgi:hypothetical protein
MQNAGFEMQRVPRGALTVLTFCILNFACAAGALAQWPAHLPAGVPLTADGKPNLDAPPPRTPDGKVDLSGVWETAPPRRPGAPAATEIPGGQAGALPPAEAPRTPPAGAPGTGNVDPLSRNVFGNIGAQTEGGAPYQPWAAALVKKRMADNSKDNPDAHCLPMGVMQLTAHPYPKKIIQTPKEVVLIYEGSGTTVREVFLDGRPLPSKDADPWWNGYSVGHWEGDTLVVETSGFMDDGWLDVRGSPLTSAGKLIERYHRPSYGALDIEVTIDDPKAYTKPFTATVHNRLLADTQLIEFVCIDKDAQHYVGNDKK